MIKTNVEFLQWPVTFLKKKTSGSRVKDGNMPDQQLAEELQKPIIKKINKNKVQSLFMDNIWGAELADMQLISKYVNLIENFVFYYVLLIFSVNAHWLFL